MNNRTIGQSSQAKNSERIYSIRGNKTKFSESEVLDRMDDFGIWGLINKIRSLSDGTKKVLSIAALLFLLVRPTYIPGQGMSFQTLAVVESEKACQDLKKEFSFKTLCMEGK